jgi:FixJ family two-component response regulator
MTGVDVHEELLRRDWSIPTVFLAGSWNVQMVVNAMRAGADGFLAKPFDSAEVVDTVAVALRRSSAKQQQGATALAARLKVASLTPRKREIVRMVIAGMLNKEIADALDLALITVKVHRGHAMKKLGADNVAALVRLVRHDECGRIWGGTPGHARWTQT